MKMLKTTRLALLSFLFSCLAIFAAETACVTNLTATPRTPWNGLVDITYSLECDTPDAVMAVSFQGFDYDRNESVPMTALTGDGAGGELLPAGGPYHIAWDSANDWPEGHSSEFTVTATVEVKETTPLYLVVDLNTGAVTPSTTGPDLSDDTCRTTELWLRRIPKGTFTMGSPEGEVGREPGSSKETQHQVTLTEDFYIGVFEITQKQYSLIYGSNPSYYKGDTRPVESVSYDTIRGTGSTTGAGWPTYGHAVDSGSFLGKLRAKTGKTFDLPTEAQWEYACRAGTNTALNTGKNLTSEEQDSAVNEAGRYKYNQNDGKGGYSSNHTMVGSYLPNAWGLYDMHGNISEWCLDWHKSELGNSTVTDPQGDSSGSSRVVRGGDWNSYGARNCRSAYRNGSLTPSGNGYYSDNGDHGFRVVLLLTADAEEPEPTPEPDFTSGYLVVDLITGAVTPSAAGPDLSNDTCRTTELWLRRIPKGTFTMGSPEDEVGRLYSYTRETQHQVTLTKDFYIGVFEITQKQYSLIYGSNPSKYKGDTRPVESVSYDTIRGTGSHNGAGWPTCGHAVDEDSFLGKLRAKTGKTFNLPTEAQWEYACRAGTTTALNTGKNLTSETEKQDSAVDEAGRYECNQNDGKGGYSSNHTKVGSYLPNAWGLYDMHGNVSEWCLDWQKEDLGSSAVTDPKGPINDSQRVERGGSWYTVAWLCRSAHPRSGSPSFGDDTEGFRVVLLLTADAEEPEPTPEPDFTSDYLVVDLNTGAVTPSSTGPDLSDDTCRTTELWLRRIPKGTFTMGSPEGEQLGWGGDGYKETQHQVTLTKDFYIGVFEITQKQYSLIQGSNPSYYKGDTRPVDKVSYDTIRGTGSPNHVVKGGPFLGKLNAMTGLTFDLPTEAQWEYACRAGTTTALNTGKNCSKSAMDEAGRYNDNNKDGKSKYEQHAKVGSYLPNAWGLYDMHGNVLEWCLDSGPVEPGSSAVTDPKGSNSGSSRMMRGGSWLKDAWYCRSARRVGGQRSYDNGEPAYWHALYDYGFRVVLLP